MAGTYYVPGESGAALSNYGYFRLKIDQTYDAATNRSTLSITPQIKCTGNAGLTPLNAYFLKDNLVSGAAEVRVDGVKVGEVAGTTSSPLRGLSSDINKWIGLGRGGTPFVITVNNVQHDSSGAKTVTVSYGRIYATTVDGSIYGTSSAASSSISIPAATYTLSISATGCTVTVKHGSTTLSNGASVTYGWVLTITATASTGYNAPTIKVNGAALSGSSYTVAGDVAVAATATKIAYTLTIDQGPNSTIKVLRNGSTLSNGATVYYGDQLAITMTANSGYHLTTATVSGATASGGYYVVGGNVTVTTVAAGNYKTLRILTAEGVSVSVTRDGVSLSDNADIAVDDVLTIIATAATGYENATVTVTGATKDGNEYTVTDNVTVTPSATKQSFTLAVSPATGSSISVMRGSEELHDGDTIYYGDALVISAVPDSGYGILTLTVNGSPFANGATHVVSAAVTVVTTTEELVGAYLKLATGWARYAAYIFSNAWNRYVPHIKTTTGWVKY